MPSRIETLAASAFQWAAFRLVKPMRPPVLVLSLPRSGSSWVGGMLGGAADAMYLREPVTQSDARFHEHGTVFPPEESEFLDAYRRLADRAFRGIPDFDDKVVIARGQWNCRGRARRRLVIKEVNPLACRFYLERYRPRLIFLIRHPAAVARSMRAQGWMCDGPGAWEAQGAFQGSALMAARNMMEYYESVRAVTFRSLCADPVQGFAELYDFAGLTWCQEARDHVRRHSEQSRDLVEAWRDQVAPEERDALREGYLRFGLPWFAEDSDW